MGLKSDVGMIIMQGDSNSNPCPQYYFRLEQMKPVWVNSAVEKKWKVFVLNGYSQKGKGVYPQASISQLAEEIDANLFSPSPNLGGGIKR